MKRKTKRQLKIFFKAVWMTFKIIFNTAAIIAAVFLVTVIMKGFYKLEEYHKEAIEVVNESSAETFRQEETSYISDDKGSIIAKLKLDKDTQYLKYEEIPTIVQDAFISVEDRSFWEHKGIDFKGLLRVAVNYVRTGGDEVHGASTITQQLARNVFLTHEVSIERKLKEIFISTELEKKYTKKEILEFYINSIYYGNGYYGIGAAATGYFSKKVNDLTISEVALLCGIPNNPSAYDPIDNLDRALLRRDKIIRNLCSEGYITERERDEALAQDIVLNIAKAPKESYLSTYATNCAVQYLMQQEGFEFKYKFNTMEDYESYNDKYAAVYSTAKYKLLTGGYRIKTTLNQEAQKVLQEAIDNTLAFSTESDENGTLALQGAATIIDNNTGCVIAIVGGRSDNENGTSGVLNRAYQSHRQPGSTIKPIIVYTPALERSYTPNTIVDDTKVENGPENAGKYSGKITLRSAVEQSKNTVAWQVFNNIGPVTGLSYAQEMHFSQIVPDDYYLSAALGGLTYGVTTTEMASAYATLANCGAFSTPTCIMSIIKDDKEIYKAEPLKQIYTAKATSEMIDVLKGVVVRGTAAKIGWDQNKMPAAVKTGTTNNSKDGWFCGTTPYYSIAVWVGFDKPKSLTGLWGATYPAQIWKTTMETLVEDLEYKDFSTIEDESEETTEDEGVENTDAAWGSDAWFAQHDPNEELSAGYTYGTYQLDLNLLSEVDSIANEMASLHVSNETERTKALTLYSDALSKVNQIYGTTCKQEALAKLNNAYSAYSNNY